METQRKKQTQRQKNVFIMTSVGFVIAVRNNSLIDSKWHSLGLPSNYFKGLKSKLLHQELVICIVKIYNLLYF